MAASTLKLAFASGFVFSETALAATVKQVKGSGATVRGVELTNTGNEDVYVKGYFVATPGGVSVGTTAPDFIWMVPALKQRRVLIRRET